jgi:hypothetical protein
MGFNVIAMMIFRRAGTFLPSVRSQIVFIKESSAVNIPVISLRRHGMSPLTLSLDPSKSIRQIVEQQSRRQNFRTLEMFSLHGTKYSSSTSISDIINQPFNIEVDDTYNYVVVNHDIGYVDLPDAPEDKVLADKYFWQHGLSSKTSEILAYFNRNLKDNLDLLEGNSVSRDLLRALVNKVILERANEYRNYAKTLTAHITALEDIYQEELRLKAELEHKAAKSASRKIGGFVSVVVAQFVGVQYGTYYLFSWDIMEPITCMMTMGDSFFAYWFWMRSQENYDTDGMRRYFYQAKLDKLYRKSRFARSEVERVHQLIANLKNKRRELIT